MEDFERHERFYQTILNLSHDGIVGVDNDGRIIIYNQAAANFLGIPIAEALGGNIAKINPKAGLPRVLAEQSVQHDELRSIELRTAIINRAPVYQNGQLIGAVSSIRDVTELQQYEEAMRRKLSQQGLQAKWTLSHFVAESAPMQRLLRLAHRYAAVDSTLLLQGESGTGKEMLAQGIHAASHRAKGPFVALNCAAVPETLLESELFGYEEGAFTGARRGGKTGLFELAHHGTLFLDEIGELPISLQARLLRVLQERSVMRVGGSKIIPVNARIIAATNRDLIGQIHRKHFREDLYFRLAVLVLSVPPLREHASDIPYLIEAFTRESREMLGTPMFQLDEDDSRRLQEYSWPGNVRELRNLMERAFVLSEENKPIHLFDDDIWLPVELSHSDEISHSSSRPHQTDSFVLEDETSHILRVLREEHDNISRAARRLGMHRTTLWRKLGKIKK